YSLGRCNICLGHDWRTVLGSGAALRPRFLPGPLAAALPIVTDVRPATRPRARPSALRPAGTAGARSLRRAGVCGQSYGPRLARRSMTLPDLGIEVVEREHLRAMAQCDLALTYPGTNNDELAILGVPMIVVVPLERVSTIRTPGLSEWLGRIPGISNLVKAVVVGHYLRHHRLLAWPNQHAGRMLVPEIVGRFTPA